MKNTCFEVVQANRVSVLRVVVSAVTSKTFQERTFISPISCEPQWIIIWRIPDIPVVESVVVDVDVVVGVVLSVVCKKYKSITGYAIH